MLLMPFTQFVSANPFHNYNIAPKVTVLSPITDYVYNQSGVPLNVIVEMKSEVVDFFPSMHEDPEELAWIKYSVDGQANVTVSVKNEMDNKYDYITHGTVAGNISGIPTGAHKLTVYGGTKLTNHTEILHSFNVSTYFIVKSVNPAIQVLSPQQITYSSPTVYIEFKNNRTLSWEGYSIDQKSAVTLHDSRTNMNLFNGNHTLRIYGEDTQGNICASQAVAFTVNTRKPPTVKIQTEGLISNFSSVTYFNLVFKVSQPTSWMGFIMDGGTMHTANKTGVLIKTTYGTHTITAYAKDLCGNSGISDPFTITLTKPESVPHASTSFPDIFGAPSPTSSNTEQPNPNTADLQPNTTNTKNQQPRQSSFPITTVAASAALVAFASLACIFLYKRSHRR
jgi:hypothetical protein